MVSLDIEFAISTIIALIALLISIKTARHQRQNEPKEKKAEILTKYGAKIIELQILKANCLTEIKILKDTNAYRFGDSELIESMKEFSVITEINITGIAEHLKESMMDNRYKKSWRAEYAELEVILQNKILLIKNKLKIAKELIDELKNRYY